MSKSVGGLVVVAAAAFAGAAMAAPLVITSRDLGGGNAAVVACDTDGFTHSYTTVRGNVTAVTVGGIRDPACEGGTIRVTIASSSDTSIASGGPTDIPADGDTLDNSVILATSPQPSATQVASIHVAVEGP